MIDYSIFSRTPIRPQDLASGKTWDVLVSGFTQSERVQRVFSESPAGEKHWLLLPDYGLSPDLISGGDFVYFSNERDEDAYFNGYFDRQDLRNKSVCVDITGILRPHLLFLMRRLSELGLDSIDVMYSEPAYYKAKESTPFAGHAVERVRTVRGFEGSPTPGASELLIIGAGYESHLISALCLAKEPAKKVLLLGFPPLKPEMYQESLLRISADSEGIGLELDDEGRAPFAPANDPFETAAVLHRVLRSEQDAADADMNIYLSPLATKAQTLAFFVFFECELCGGSASILFPFTSTHNPDTSEGLSRVWRYRIEFESFRRLRAGLSKSTGVGP